MQSALNVERELLGKALVSSTALNRPCSADFSDSRSKLTDVDLSGLLSASSAMNRASNCSSPTKLSSADMFAETGNCSANTQVCSRMQ